MFEISSVRTCVLYDPQDGTIVHIHKEIAVIGAPEATETEIEEKIRKFAARDGRDTKNLKTAFVNDSRSNQRHYKIDTTTLEFVEVTVSRS